MMDEKGPRVRKLGTVDCDMVETTPVVFRDRLYRFEYVRANYPDNPTGESYFRFVDVDSGRSTPPFAPGCHLGSAHVEGDVVYVYGVDRWGGSEILVYRSCDLEVWDRRPALSMPRWGIYNNSVCRGRDRFVMAFEVGEPPELVGERFTIFFAQSDDLIRWSPMSTRFAFAKDRYTACPVIRYAAPHYYMIYLEKVGDAYESHIVRSSDLARWESSPLNPVLRHSAEDRWIRNDALTADQRGRIAMAVNLNNSDVDLCEFRGKVVIYYSWGNQRGVEHLAEAVHEGTLEGFLLGYFPTPSRRTRPTPRICRL